MADVEGLTLDALDLNDDADYILEAVDFTPPAKRQDWLSNADADGEVLVAAPRYPRRAVTARIRIERQASMDDALDLIAAIEDKLQLAPQTTGGIDLVWTPANSTYSYTLKVRDGEFTNVPVTNEGDDAGWLLRFPVVEIRLDCDPFGYGDEVTVAGSASTAPLQTLEVPSVPGDVEAEGRLMLTDGATKSRMHFEWGLEAEGYNPSVPSDLLLEKADLTATGFAGSSTTRSGSFGANIWRATLSTMPVVVCGTNTADTDSRNHVGVFRVKARVFASGTGPYGVRLAWRAGAADFTRNAYAAPLDDAWTDLDLGTITIPEANGGVQSWEGRIEAISDTIGDTLDVDYLLLIPARRYGRAATPAPVTSVPPTFSARSDFTTETGVISGDSLAVGGTWTVAGDPDDFSVAAGVATRTAVSDSVMPGTTIIGHAAVASGFSAGSQAATIDFKHSAIVAAPLSGFCVRYVNSTNFALAVVNTYGAVVIYTVVAGTPTAILSLPAGTAGTPLADTYYRLQVDVTGGVVTLFAGPVGGQLVKVGSAYAAVLETTLATGLIGIFDAQGGSTACTRTYDNFAAWVPEARGAITSGQSLEVRHDSALRENAAGTIWGDIPGYRGSRFFIPPAGAAGLTSRVVAKARRNNVDETADDFIADSTTLSVAYTPRYLVIPRA